ncbi:hypothetical protein AX14_007283 [Amanita brunnescens Koide BX004]|nr:hypothetical protein AX14_007283 [Amanita brunnescens Koide BX004]
MGVRDSYRRNQCRNFAQLADYRLDDDDIFAELRFNYIGVYEREFDNVAMHHTKLSLLNGYICSFKYLSRRP